MILHTGDLPLPNLGRCLVGRGRGRGRAVVCQVGRAGRGRRREDRLGVFEIFGAADVVGGVLRLGRGRRLRWVVTSSSSGPADPPLRRGGRFGIDFLVGRTCVRQKLVEGFFHLDDSSYFAQVLAFFIAAFKLNIIK